MKMNLPVTGREQFFSADKNMVTKTNTKGIITFANKDFMEVSGFSEEELLGKNHNIIRHPDMPPAAFEIMWKTIQRGLPWQGMVKNRCKNGDHYWVNARIVPIKKNGAITGYMSVRSCPSREQVAEAEATYQAAMTAPETLKENASSRWGKHFSIKNGIPLWILFVTLLMIGGGILGMIGINLSKADIQALYHQEMMPAQALHRVNFLMSDNRAQLGLALNFKFGTHSETLLNHSSGNKQLQRIQQNKNEIDHILAHYISQVTDEPEKELANQYIQARNRYVAQGLLPAIHAIEAEDYLAAQRIFFRQVNPLYEEANTRASTLLEYLLARGHGKLIDTTVRADVILKMVVGGIAISCLVLVVAGFFFFRITAKPLEQAVLALEDMAEGNLSNPVNPSGYGEPGRVMTAVLFTQMHLKVMIYEIQQSSDSIHRQCNNLNKLMMDLAEHSDEQQDRIYQTVDAVNASRSALASIATQMDTLLETLHAGEDDSNTPLMAHHQTPVSDLDWMPPELLAAFGEEIPAAIPIPATLISTPAPTEPSATAVALVTGTPCGGTPLALRQQVQRIASAARGQALAIEEVAHQLSQVAALVVQNREDVQGAWAASQQLEQAARELDELVKYFD